MSSDKSTQQPSNATITFVETARARARGPIYHKREERRVLQKGKRKGHARLFPGAFRLANETSGILCYTG